MNEFLKRFNLSEEDEKNIEKVKRMYPMKVTEYYAGLIKQKGDPIWKQCIPDLSELDDTVNDEDPLHEEKHTPVPFLVHRYPDRALFLVSNKCAMYCRFCTRKRKVGKTIEITRSHIANALDYIRGHPEIRDVIVSGGDPLMLSDDDLEFVLKGLKEISHVQIVRIGTRVPCVMPSRITEKLCSMLKKYHPLFMNLHFEHPAEITDQSINACRMLSEAGISLGNQSVLLKGVNDDPAVLKELFHKLVAMRIRPYYLYQADQVKGTEHFRTDISVGLKIMENMYGHTSGICIPQYVVDTYGGGKIPIVPDFTILKSKDRIILRNFEGKAVEYRNPLKQADKTTAHEEKKFSVAIAFNLKKEPEKNMPNDIYAEFDDISVPMAIKEAFERNGFEASLVEADDDFYFKMKSGKYDFVFNIAEGFNGSARESQVPAILDMLNIPYTGSGVFTQAATLDKAKSKEILLYHGVNTPKFQLFTSAQQKLNPELSFPLFVKPNAEGSSKGIRNNSIVHNEEELRERVRSIISSYKQPALVEEFVDGREFTVAIIGNSSPKVLPIVEVTFDYLPDDVNKIDSYEVKWYWDNPSSPIDPIICPAKVPKQLENRIKAVALKAYKALGCVDLCRMDIRLDNMNRPNVLDINALPGLMPDPLENSRFPKSCYTAGMTYDDIIMTVFSEAAKRYGLSKKIELKQAPLAKEPNQKKEKA